jgi:hypothetical protein
MSNDSTKGRGAPGGRSGAPRDRRATHRAAIEIPAVLKMGAREVHCTIRDLGSQGVAVAVRESIAPGMVVRVVFRLPNARQPVEVAAVPLRSDGARREGRVGLSFIDPAPDAVRAIETFVARNRSDQPFSRRRAAAAGTPGAGTSESGHLLDELYNRAVSEVDEMGSRRPGVFERWRRRGR